FRCKKKKMGKKNPTDTADPVNNFERWKKKYNTTKTRVKQEKIQKRKPEWQVEKEGIQRLVNKYNEINAKDAERFSDFPISKNTLISCLGLTFLLFTPGLMEAQYCQPTEIQRQTIDFALQGKDVLECLSTAMDGLGALIISPTRELNHEFSAGLIIGRKVHYLLSSTFLDKVDRILDIGFADTINAIVENLPKTRQTLLFSATQTKSVKDLARLSLQDPEYVWVHEKAKFSTPATLEQNYVVCELSKNVNMLFSFIRSHLQKKVIVLFACCQEVQYLLRVFCRLRPGMPILALHGKQQQMKRVEVYNDFIKKKNAVLFATDIAARGLDFPAVNWVLQFHCPEDANTHIHRVGRTARYKEGGEALLVLLPSEEERMLSQLQEKKCFVSYLRSVYLMKNKEVFDVFQLKLQEYAAHSCVVLAVCLVSLSCCQVNLHRSTLEQAFIKDLSVLCSVHLSLDPDYNTMKNTEKETKFKEAKKVLKRNFQMVQQWPPLQRTAVPATEGEEDDGTTGINVEEARERLRREDLEFDKLEHRRKVKEKHRVRLYCKDQSKTHNVEQKKQAEKTQGKTEQKSEEEVVAYLDGADGEEFDPSTLPDPDKLCSFLCSEEDDDQSSHAAGMRKRSLSDCSDDSGEEDEVEGSRKRPRQQAAAKPLDTGLSLAEDEELVLHLLGNRR
uniref:ATP-dependent RNA helicase n=1 Tax=Oncorhynchus mykiss TaxID=8022 RepID=A0A8C7VY09_ONCMY